VRCRKARLCLHVPVTSKLHAATRQMLDAQVTTTVNVCVVRFESRIVQLVKRTQDTASLLHCKIQSFFCFFFFTWCSNTVIACVVRFATGCTFCAESSLVTLLFFLRNMWPAIRRARSCQRFLSSGQAVAVRRPPVTANGRHRTQPPRVAGNLRRHLRQ